MTLDEAIAAVQDKRQAFISAESTTTAKQGIATQAHAAADQADSDVATAQAAQKQAATDYDTALDALIAAAQTAKV